jgi:hypothetical protein
VLVTNAVLSALPASASTSVVPFEAFGYRDTILERGPNASLSVFVPVATGLQSVHLHAPITISPQADPGSSIEVTANDIPVSTISVRTAGRTPTIDVTIPVPHGAKSLSIAIVGRLFELGGICSFLRDDVWFTVSNNARLTITTNQAQSNDQIADFLNQYGGMFVVVDRGNDADSRSATMQLAYRLHQVERWRRTTVTLGGSAGGDARRVVVLRDYFDLPVHQEELAAAPVDDGTLRAAADLFAAHGSLVLANIGGSLTMLAAVPLEASVIDAIRHRFGAVSSMVATRSHVAALREQIDGRLQAGVG